MKHRFLITYFFFLSSICILGQHNTMTFSGSVSSTTTWNAYDTIYISGNVTIGTGVTLTIAPNTTGSNGGNDNGVFVVFRGAYNITKSNAGALNVNGTYSHKINFTADRDKDHIFGESGESWGHIYFSGHNGTSTINNANIEYGSSGYGGGIYIRAGTGTVTIKNSIIHNCTATGYGGGIQITSASPSIENCIIYKNSGAGIDISGGSPTIMNCTIISNDNPNETEFGGIQIASGAVVTTNCILWNNKQGTNEEQDYGDLGGESTITYSALTQTINGLYDLNAENENDSDPNKKGPHFNNPSSNDYSITSESPCIDIGTDTGSPSTDIIGNSRVGTTDIGAYESLDFKWQGDDGSNPTDWGVGNNWNRGYTPVANCSVIIPDDSNPNNDPIVNENPATPAICNTLTIYSGAVLTIAAGKALTVNGAMTNNGKLILKSDANGTASLIMNSYSKGGSMPDEFELYLTGGGTKKTYKWHYISSPVDQHSIDIFTAQTNNLAEFIESRPFTDLISGWVGWDGWDYEFGRDDPALPGFSTLSLGKGYNYYDTDPYTFKLSGTINTSNKQISLDFSNRSNLSGFNLLGNPFSSGLDWDQITSNGYPINTSKCLYFTKDNQPAYYIGGVGMPDNSVTAMIPPMQGFFVKTYFNNGVTQTITLPASARIHTNQARYKGSSIIPLVRLKLQKDLKTTDETVVRFDNAAKSDFDLDFDAYKLQITSTETQIYSQLGGISYAINGLPFPDTFVEIPLVLNIAKDTIHSITAFKLQGLENYNVTLKDNITGYNADLKTSPVVSFTSAEGTISGRFILKISLITTGVENPVSLNNIFNIYNANNYINIQTVSDEWNGKQGSVKVMDLTGRILNNLNNIEFTRNDLIQIPEAKRNGIYIVEIRSGLLRHTGKVIVK
jgi:hypothetical protein